MRREQCSALMSENSLERSLLTATKRSHACRDSFVCNLRESWRGGSYLPASGVSERTTGANPNNLAKIRSDFRLASGRLPGAPLGARWIHRRIADEFRSHQAGDEEFSAVVVKIDGGPFGVGLRDHSHAVLLMPNLLSIRENLHIFLLKQIPPHPGQLREARLSPCPPNLG